MTTVKANFIRRIIKNALRLRKGEIQFIGDSAYMIPLNYLGDLNDGDRFANDSMIVTVLDDHLLIVKKTV